MTKIYLEQRTPALFKFRFICCIRSRLKNGVDSSLTLYGYQYDFRTVVHTQNVWTGLSHFVSCKENYIKNAYKVQRRQETQYKQMQNANNIENFMKYSLSKNLIAYKYREKKESKTEIGQKS